MLSVLLPVYNENVVELVISLQYQCVKLQIAYEIICIDDCSKEDIHKKNQKGLQENHVQYHRLPKNIGRSRIRNKLIALSKYNWLLFIDADHKVISDNYIATYASFFDIKSDTIIYGGTVYPEKSMRIRKHLIHWHYGSMREAITAKKRSKSPVNHLHTNNLLIQKDRLGDIRFDESIEEYGYEDILFSQTLYRDGKTIKHINNPLMHLGLKSNETFIHDLKTASQTLAILYTQSKITETKVIHAFQFLKRSSLLKPVIYVLRKCEHRLIKMLKIRPQFLYAVDGLRLLYFVEAMHIRHKSQS